MAASGPQNGQQGLERCLPLGSWALLSTFATFDLSPPSMRKGRDGGEKQEKMGGGVFGNGGGNGEIKKKRLMIIVATSSLPAVDRPKADCWNAALSCQYVEGVLGELKG